MSLTPRQIDAYLEFSKQIDSGEHAAELWLGATAASGNGKEIEKTLKGLIDAAEV